MQHKIEVNFQCYCCLCKKTQFFQVPNPKIKTTRLCVLILKSLKCLQPTQDFFSLKTDIYNFIYDHWHLLEKLKLFQKTQWRKSILDAFNHCSLIESGKDANHNRGFYRLKEGNNELFKTEKIGYQREMYESLYTLGRID
ncbi:Uncharacterized protein QTN25_009752 [Entamoeba marina]